VVGNVSWRGDHLMEVLKRVEGFRT